jgi:hypothetical protein
MICHRSLLLTTISRLYGTCPSSGTSCAVVISYWLPHFQPPSYSKGATLTICFVLCFLHTIIVFVHTELISQRFWKIVPVAFIKIILTIMPYSGKTHLLAQNRTLVRQIPRLPASHRIPMEDSMHYRMSYSVHCLP